MTGPADTLVRRVVVNRLLRGFGIGKRRGFHDGGVVPTDKLPPVVRRNGETVISREQYRRLEARLREGRS